MTQCPQCGYDCFNLLILIRREFITCPQCKTEIPNDRFMNDIDIVADEWIRRIEKMTGIYCSVYPNETRDTLLIKSTMLVSAYYLVEKCSSKEHNNLPERETNQKTIYFIQGVSGGPIKIGITTNITARLKALQTYEPLIVLATMQGDEKDERSLHARFSQHRKEGEWFEAHEEILSYISTL